MSLKMKASKYKKKHHRKSLKISKQSKSKLYNKYVCMFVSIFYSVSQKLYKKTLSKY